MNNESCNCEVSVNAPESSNVIIYKEGRPSLGWSHSLKCSQNHQNELYPQELRDLGIST